MQIIDSTRVFGSGLYRMSPEDYFLDPCPTPSLSASIARIMLDRSPLHAWHRHPRLKPDWQPDEGSSRLDFGAACHRLLLGAGRELDVVDCDDWRTKAAREAGAEARRAGRIPILSAEHRRACDVVHAAALFLDQQADCRPLFTVGDTIGEFAGAAEVALAWQEQIGPRSVWCRALLDGVEADGGCIVDYKTTMQSAAPHAVARTIYSLGYHLQAQWYRRGLAAVTGRDPSQIRHLLIVQEVDAPPYALSVVATDRAADVVAEKMIGVALATWSECLATGKWPGYPGLTIEAEFPSWQEAEWLEREDAAADAARLGVELHPMMAG